MRPRPQIMFVQGGGEGAHDEWDHALVASLGRELGERYEIRYPRMPNEAEPRYLTWKSALEKELEALSSGAVLIGHSVGGTMLLRTLAEHSSLPHLRAIVLLAAPFVGDGGWSSDELPALPELGARLPRDVPIHFYQGLDDETVPPSHVELYARAVPQARVHRMRGRDHQFKNDLREVARLIAALETTS